MDKLVLTTYDRAELENIVLDCLKAFHKHNPQPQPAPPTPLDDPERLISKKEAARLLGCSQSTIDNYRRAGVLEAVKLGKAVRFRRGDVLAVVQPQNVG
jgi:excisionase family DNA binding protein